MAVMAREIWTDERLDDLKGQMNERFDRVEGDIKELRGDIKGLREGDIKELRGDIAGLREGEMKELRGEVKGLREGDIKELRGGINQLNTDMQAMQRAMVHGTIAICGIMTTGFMTLIGIAAL